MQLHQHKIDHPYWLLQLLSVPWQLRTRLTHLACCCIEDLHTNTAAAGVRVCDLRCSSCVQPPTLDYVLPMQQLLISITHQGNLITPRLANSKVNFQLLLLLLPCSTFLPHHM
jgi:hypothetical protein